MYNMFHMMQVQGCCFAYKTYCFFDVLVAVRVKKNSAFWVPKKISNELNQEGLTIKIFLWFLQA